MAEHDDDFDKLDMSRCSKEEIVNVLKEAKKKAREEKQRLEQEKKELQARIEKLEKEKNDQQSQARKHHLVVSASQAAKDPDIRNEFRKNQVAEVPCRGGFIAQKFYLDFVLAAREVGADNLFEKQKRETIIEEVQSLGNVLQLRQEFSVFNNDFLDEEAPQSAVGAELFKLAIHLLCEKSTLRVTHQQHLVSNIDSFREEVKILRKRRNESSDDDKKASATTPEKKSFDQIDISIWFVKSVEREAQADMYGSNIFVLHKKQCVVVDIAGSNKLSDWTVSAHGLVQADFKEENEKHQLEKVPLYSGKGAEGIVMVCRGLLAGQKSFVNKLDDYGSRLGPVVGVLDEKIYKVYDGAKSRQPNLNVVKKILDKEAELLISRDGKLQILKMKCFPSNWKVPVKATIFRLIAERLSQLHRDFGPHGDIRLANLLSDGKIIDFDFVGLDSYPITLQKLTKDGCRHSEVDEMINAQGAKPLKPRVAHDWFSLAYVMKLFVPTSPSHSSTWTSICAAIEKINEDMNENTLDNFPAFELELKDLSMPLNGTGPSPQKKQPSNRSKRQRRSQASTSKSVDEAASQVHHT